jgi:hypothetical protein
MHNANSSIHLAQSLMRLSMDHQTRLFQVIEALQDRVRGDRVPCQFSDAVFGSLQSASAIAIALGYTCMARYA